jgi:hypothetical protein
VAAKKKRATKRGPQKGAPGAGRPPLAPELRSDARVTVRFTPAERALLSKLAAALGVDPAEAVRVSVRLVASQNGVIP